MVYQQFLLAASWDSLARLAHQSPLQLLPFLLFQRWFHILVLSSEHLELIYFSNDKIFVTVRMLFCVIKTSRKTEFNWGLAISYTLSQKIFSIQVLKKWISPKKGFCKINNDRIKIVLLTERPRWTFIKYYFKTCKIKLKYDNILWIWQ